RPTPPKSTLFPYTTLFRSQLTTKRKPPCGGFLFVDQATSFLRLFSAAGDVANRALPLAQLRKSTICSAIVFDNGTKSVNAWAMRSEEHTSELQSLRHLVCR